MLFYNNYYLYFWSPSSSYLSYSGVTFRCLDASQVGFMMSGGGSIISARRSTLHGRTSQYLFNSIFSSLVVRLPSFPLQNAFVRSFSCCFFRVSQLYSSVRSTRTHTSHTYKRTYKYTQTRTTSTARKSPVQIKADALETCWRRCPRDRRSI